MLCEPFQTVELGVRLRFGLLAEPVDPDRAKPERRRRRDVVEEARGYVDVRVGLGAASGEELVPMSARRLVGADLGRNDRELELDAESREGRVEEIAVGVRQDGQPPARGSYLRERLGHLDERCPPGERAAERVLLVCGSAKPRKSNGHYLAIGPAWIFPLDLRLELVIRVQQLTGTRRAEEPLELAPDAAVPVDQRPVAVERRPALTSGHGREPIERRGSVLEAAEHDAGV